MSNPMSSDFYGDLDSVYDSKQRDKLKKQREKERQKYDEEQARKREQELQSNAEMDRQKEINSLQEQHTKLNSEYIALNKQALSLPYGSPERDSIESKIDNISQKMSEVEARQKEVNNKKAYVDNHVTQAKRAEQKGKLDALPKYKEPKKNATTTTDNKDSQTPKETATTENNQTPGETTTTTTTSSTTKNNISPEAYAMLNGIGFGKDPSLKTEHQRRQAAMHDIQAGDEAKNSQRNMQKANRNAKDVAAEYGAAKAAAENEQKVNNMANASAGAAALERGTQVGDALQVEQMQNEQFDKGVANQREMWGARQTAEQERSDAGIGDYKFRQTAAYNGLSDYLSRGGANEQTTETTQTTETQPAPQDKAPEPEPEPEPEPKDDPEQFNTDWQSVLNYITFGNDRTSGWSNNQKDGGAARKFAEAHGWKPVNMSQAQWDAKGANAEGIRQQIVAKQAPEFYAAWKQGSHRFDTGKQINAGDNGATVQQFHDQSQVKWETGADGQMRPIQ